MNQLPPFQFYSDGNSDIEDNKSKNIAIHRTARSGTYRPSFKCINAEEAAQVQVTDCAHVAVENYIFLRESSVSLKRVNSSVIMHM